MIRDILNFIRLLLLIVLLFLLIGLFDFLMTPWKFIHMK